MFAFCCSIPYGTANDNHIYQSNQKIIYYNKQALLVWFYTSEENFQ